MSTTPRTNTPRGALVVFEGLDRSGKSTQVNKLYERLKSEGKQVKKIGFPGMSFTLSHFISTKQKGGKFLRVSGERQLREACLKGWKLPSIDQILFKMSMRTR